MKALSWKKEDCGTVGSIIIPIAVQLQLFKNHMRSVCICICMCHSVPQFKTLEVILPNLCVWGRKSGKDDSTRFSRANHGQSGMLEGGCVSKCLTDQSVLVYPMVLELGLTWSDLQGTRQHHITKILWLALWGQNYLTWISDTNHQNLVIPKAHTTKSSDTRMGCRYWHRHVALLTGDGVSASVMGYL